nr:G protein-coupled receptor [Proales similis]
MEPTVSIAFASAFSAMWLVSLLGNSLTAAAIIRRRQLRTSPPFVLIVNLVASELAVSTFILPVITWHLVTGRSLIAGNQLLCDIQGGLLSMFGTSVVFFLNLISLNRFLFVFRPQLYKKLFTLRRTFVISTLLWLTSLLHLSNLFAAQSETYYKKSFFICVFTWPVEGLSLSVTVLLLFVPVLVAIGVYTILLRATRRLKSQLQVRGGIDLRLEAIRFIEFLFFSWLLVILLGLPFVFLTIVDLDVSIELTQLCIALSGLHFSINWLILVAGNSNLRSSLRDLIFAGTNDAIDSQQRQVMNAIRVLSDDY